MKRAIIIAAALAIAGCSPSEVDSVSTTVSRSADALYAAAQVIGRHLVITGEISQARYDDWNARAQLALLALTHAVVSMAYLGLLVAAIERATHVLRRRGVRQALDALTGTALGVFSLRLATEHA